MGKRKALVLGAGGLVGSALVRSLLNYDDIETIASEGRKSLDLRNQPEARNMILDVNPDVIFLSAYITNVDACEDRSTDSLNMDGCFDIVSTAADIDARLVFVSSSYVFSGKSPIPYRISDIPLPINHYGAQKLAVEDFIHLVCKNHLIVRTVGVFGPDNHAKSFPHQIIRAANSGQRLLIPEDQWMTPCHSDFLSDLMCRAAIRSDYSGVLHISGDKSVTKYEFAEDILHVAGVFADIRPIASEDIKQIAKRPRMGSLDSSSITQIYPNVFVPSYEESLKRFDRYG